MPVTATDIVNEALQMIGGNQPLVTGNSPTFDNSTAGKSAAQIYVPTVQAVMRLFEWDMGRSTVNLAPSGNAAPWPWAYEYVYPANGAEIWQLAPASITDPNNPLPTNWSVANATVSGAQARVIHTDVPNARVIYNNTPAPDVWDGVFKEAVVRLLASKFAMAVAGKPETSALMLESFNAFVNAAKSRDG